MYVCTHYTYMYIRVIWVFHLAMKWQVADSPWRISREGWPPGRSRHDQRGLRPSVPVPSLRGERGESFEMIPCDHRCNCLHNDASMKTHRTEFESLWIANHMGFLRGWSTRNSMKSPFLFSQVSVLALFLLLLLLRTPETGQFTKWGLFWNTSLEAEKCRTRQPKLPDFFWGPCAVS